MKNTDSNVLDLPTHLQVECFMFFSDFSAINSFADIASQNLRVYETTGVRSKFCFRVYFNTEEEAKKALFLLIKAKMISDLKQRTSFSEDPVRNFVMKWREKARPYFRKVYFRQVFSSFFVYAHASFFFDYLWEPCLLPVFNKFGLLLSTEKKIEKLVTCLLDNDRNVTIENIYHEYLRSSHTNSEVLKQYLARQSAWYFLCGEASNPDHEQSVMVSVM